MGNQGQPWSAMKLGLQRQQPGFTTVGDHLHPTVRQIPAVPRETKAARSAEHKCAEPDPLDPASDKEPPSHAARSPFPLRCQRR